MKNIVLYFSVLTILLSNNAALASHYAYEMDYQLDCSNYNSSETNLTCYPFFYKNSDGSDNVFADAIAVANICGPYAIAGGSVVLANCGKKVIDSYLKEEVDADLRYLNSNLAEVRIRESLARIIVNFNNGINTHSDYFKLDKVIENLTIHKCRHCIEEFVAIVSENYSLTKSNGEELDKRELKENKKKERVNRAKFRNFAKRFLSVNQPNKCAGHEFADFNAVVTPKKTWYERVKSAFFSSASHPLNWTSLAYATFTAGAAAGLAFTLPSSALAGSWIGDVANIDNAIVFSSAAGAYVFQYWWNRDSTKDKKLQEHTTKYLARIDGMVEIAAEVIGTMNNGIDVAQARGCIKMLFLLGWPKDLTESFENLASKMTTDTTIFDSIRKTYHESAIVLLRDRDISSFDEAIAVQPQHDESKSRAHDENLQGSDGL